MGRTWSLLLAQPHTSNWVSAGEAESLQGKDKEFSFLGPWTGILFHVGGP